MTFSSSDIIGNKATQSNTTSVGSIPAQFKIKSYNSSNYRAVIFGNLGGWPQGLHFSPTTTAFLTTASGNIINSNNATLSNTSTTSNSTYSADYANYVIVNNDTNNWTITLPLGPSTVSTTSTWVSGGFELYIKKTGSGTLTIQTPSDTIGTRVRGINTLSNKSLVMSSSSPQIIRLLYTALIDSSGNTDNTAEIWHVIQNKELNPVNSNGSILFAGTTSTYLTVPNDVDLRFGTGDFTVEWWQYQTDINGFPRIFSFGTYPSASFGVSIEGGTFYVWINGAGNSFGNASATGAYKNKYTHFAITRSGTTIRVFKNGTQMGTNLTSSYNFNDTTNDLRIGNESSLSTGSAFGGNIKGFHWVKGTALYTSTFTPNYNSITPHANSKLLLNVSNSAGLVTDSSGLGKTVTNTGCTFSSITLPFY